MFSAKRKRMVKLVNAYIIHKPNVFLNYLLWSSFYLIATFYANAVQKSIKKTNKMNNKLS